MALTQAEKRAKRQERLEKKADELGLTLTEYKKQKRESKLNKLAKKAKAAGMKLKDYRKQLKEERKKKRKEKMEQERVVREKRRQEGPVKVDNEVVVPANVPVEKSKDPIGDFINRHRDKGIAYIKTLVTGKWGVGSSKTKEIHDRLKKEFGEDEFNNAVHVAKKKEKEPTKSVGDKPKKSSKKPAPKKSKIKWKRNK